MSMLTSRRSVTLSAITLLAVVPLAAQSTAPTDAEKDENIVELPTFTITEDPANPYVSRQALSASRVATSIQDIPQTVSVVTSEFMQDSMANRMLDAAKYITPVTESSLPTGGDRYNIRGFQVSHEFVDGMELSGADGYSMSLAPYNIDRIEIIKGPNAILVPGGAPGGQFNPITKSPLMKDQSSVTLELAQYVGNALSVDVNRVVSADEGVAARLVAAYWDTGGYSKGYFREGFMLAPSLSWQLSDNHKLTVKAEVVRNKETNGVFLPLDPSVGSNDYAMIARGLPRDWSFGNDDDHRERGTERVSVELLSTLSDHITSRLLIAGNHVVREDQGGTNAGVTNAGGGSRNPLTGLYEPGVVWNTSAYDNDTTGTVTLTSTPAPVTDPSTWIFTRRNGADHLYYNEAHLRNDYAMTFEGEGWSSTTTGGLAANASKVHWKSYANHVRSSVANSNLDGITYEPRVYPEPATGQNKKAKQTDMQLYVYETAGFFDDRVLLSGGVSRYWATLSRVDTSGVGAIVQPSFSVSTTAKSYGIVLKPVPEVSVFYSHNSTGEALPGSLAAGSIAATFEAANGTQDEYGIKFSGLDDRLSASIAVFDIAQTNYAVPNSQKYIDPTQPQNLFLDVQSEGWEFEGAFAVNDNLTLVGNYSAYEIRTPLGTRIRAVPDETWGFYADYRFTEGALAGFGMNIGIDYRGDAVGENATGFTTSRRTLPDGSLVPNHATFKYDGRTLVNLGFTYRAESWTARLQVANVTDENYIAGALNRNSVMVGEPRSVRGSITYRF